MPFFCICVFAYLCIYTKQVRIVCQQTRLCHSQAVRLKLPTDIPHPLAVSQHSTCGEQPQALYLYCDERRDIRWNIAWAQGIFRGLRLHFIVYSNSSHNTDILHFNSSIDFPGRYLKSLFSILLQQLGNTEKNTQ